MDTIDVDAILARIDIDAVLRRVDIDALVDRVDVEKVVKRVTSRSSWTVDVQKIIDKVDIDALVEHTEIGTIIAKSTSGVAMEALDVVRAQGVGLDDFVAAVGEPDPAAQPGGPSARTAPPRRGGRPPHAELTSGGERARSDG